MTNTVLGIDLRAQALKVVFYDFDRREIVATGSAPLGFRQTDAGVAEQEAAWWLQALRSSLAAGDAAVRESARAVSVSGQQHDFVAIDKSDSVLAPVKHWCDTSIQDECVEIMDAVGGSYIQYRNNVLKHLLIDRQKQSVAEFGRPAPQKKRCDTWALIPADVVAQMCNEVISIHQ